MVDRKIRDFIERKGGKATYKSWLKKYFQTIDEDPESYFEQKHNYNKDILKFAESIKNWAPYLRQTIYQLVFVLLMINIHSIQHRRA